MLTTASIQTFINADGDDFTRAEVESALAIMEQNNQVYNDGNYIWFI